MNRRDFMKLVGGLSMAGAWSGFHQTPAQAAQPFSELALITIYASGGWDHSYFCDPRNNPTINHWATSASAGSAGNLRYAPVAENQEFFEKYFQHMLVINGIDLETNGHEGAELVQHSGGLSGFPILNALYGAIKGAGLPLTWLLDSSTTANLSIQSYTHLPSERQMRQLTDTNRRDDSREFFRTSDIKIIDKFRLERLSAQLLADKTLPYMHRKMEQLYQARTGRDLMDRLAMELPASFDTLDLKGGSEAKISKLHRTLVAIKAGVCVTANIRTNNGFDSHSDHDANHDQSLRELTRTLDYLWTKAEVLGIDERLVVHVTSDVGRTPFYNDNAGKDHWSSGSTIIMMKNQNWTNRVVGLSGPEHEKTKINPVTLQEDSAGVTLKSAHVHRALRKILGIDKHPLSQKFSCIEPEIDMFNASISSPVNV